MNIGSKIESYLLSNGISLKQLSKMTGISSKALAEKMGGKNPIFAEEYHAICKVLKVPVETFIQ